jgi:hypothetical protein
VIQYLSEDEVRRLVNACAADYRDLVCGALLTGCRYGELIGLRASDYNADAGTVTVRESKAGKARHVVLTDEGRGVFAALKAGRAHDAPLFLRTNGKPWGPSHQHLSTTGRDMAPPEKLAFGSDALVPRLRDAPSTSTCRRPSTGLPAPSTLLSGRSLSRPMSELE